MLFIRWRVFEGRLSKIYSSRTEEVKMLGPDDVVL